VECATARSEAVDKTMVTESEFRVLESTEAL